MSSINKTPHYNLSQFGDSPDDKPSWRGDYTADMAKIDSQMYRNETDATTATSTANTAKTTADNALSLAQTNKSGIAEQESYFNALGVTSPQTAQALMSTINGKAENTALTALQGTVSSLSDTVGGKADAANVYTKAQSDTTFTKQGGYSGTAQTLNQLINSNTSDISTLESSVNDLESWTRAFESEWTSLGEFTYSANPSTTISDPRCNIQCYYNEKIKAIKVFGFLAFKPTQGNEGNFTSLTVASVSPLPESLRPASDIHMDAAMIMFFNGETQGVGSYADINIGSCCVTIKTTGIVTIGEHLTSGYSDNIGNHARQSARTVLPQCIYILQQFNN